MPQRSTTKADGSCILDRGCRKDTEARGGKEKERARVRVASGLWVKELRSRCLWTSARPSQVDSIEDDKHPELSYRM